MAEKKKKRKGSLKGFTQKSGDMSPASGLRQNKMWPNMPGRLQTLLLTIHGFGGTLDVALLILLEDQAVLIGAPVE